MKKYSLGVLANETNDYGETDKYLYVQRISGDNTAVDTYREYLPISMKHSKKRPSARTRAE